MDLVQNRQLEGGAHRNAVAFHGDPTVAGAQPAPPIYVPDAKGDRGASDERVHVQNMPARVYPVARAR